MSNDSVYSTELIYFTLKCDACAGLSGGMFLYDLLEAQQYFDGNLREKRKE